VNPKPDAPSKGTKPVIAASLPTRAEARWVEEAETAKAEGLERIQRLEKDLAGLAIPAESREELSWLFSQARIAQHHIISMNAYLNLLFRVERAWSTRNPRDVVRALGLVGRPGQQYDAPHLFELYAYLTRQPDAPCAVISHGRKLSRAIEGRPVPTGAIRIPLPLDRVAAIRLIAKHSGQTETAALKLLQPELARHKRAGLSGLPRLPSSARLDKSS